MNAKELTVTILGLAGTFLLPWPGQADRPGDALQRHAVVQASACVRDCAHAEARGRKQAGSQAHATDSEHLASWRTSR